MKTKKIANIVFYKYYNEEGKEERKACIFYNNGSIDEVSYEEGIDACQEIVKERHITSKEAFKELINNDVIHVMSGSDFRRTFNDYVVDENIDDTLDNENLENDIQEEDIDDFDLDEDNSEYNTSNGIIDNDEEVEEEIEDEDLLDEEDFEEYDGDLADGDYADDDIEDENEDEVEEEIEDEDLFDEEDLEDYDLDNGSDDSIDEDIEDYDDFEEEIEEEKSPKKGILGLLHRGIEKIKKNKLVRRIVLFASAVILLATGYVFGTKNTKEGKILKSNFTTESTVSDGNDNKVELEEGQLVEGNNDFYDNYSFEQLQQVTNNKTQKSSMKNLNNTITNFNGPFADAHIEEGKDIRAALTFDEVVALQHAYNDYSTKGIKAYFNGTEMSATEMEKDYKSATLQLMGAHVIETREKPVDMSNIIKGEKEKEFYNRYHEMFMQAKEATGEDKLAKVSALRQAIRNDFPITQEIRTEGIMHADAYDSIESYKLSVVPMIAASEMMFQNLETDYTLNDSEIDFLNDIGLCNYAQNKFEKIETITLTAEEDNTNPLYEQYRNSIIGNLKEKGQYVTDDAHRNLSDLDAFQNQVNWHFKMDENGHFTGEVYYTTETHTETNTWTTQQTSYREEITTTEKAIPAEEKERIDAEIAAENAKAKAEGEKEAADTEKKMQEDADEEAEEINKEIEEEEKDLEDKIDDANDKIDENNKDEDETNDNKVNEGDFGDHDVEFDDEYSDENGNLDNSVENITTDETGDQTGEALPDPEQTGAEFDSGSGGASTGSTTDSSESSSGYTESTDQTIIEYEEAVDEYVEGLANGDGENVESYEYTK